MKLTKRAIDSFSYQGDGQSRDVRWDAAMPGFGLRIYPSGRKAFIISYRDDDRRSRLLTLGTFGKDLTLEQARTKAQKEMNSVRDGKDPLRERRKDRIVETFADLAALYVERHASGKRSGKEDERKINVELLPKWAKRKAADIKRRDVIALLDGIVDRGSPIAANRTLALIRKIYNFGISRDLVELNPCSQVTMPGKEQQRQRVLDDHELCALWEAFDGLGPIVGPMFRLRTMTLQRGAEIATMRWDDVDMEGGWWTIPPERSKNGLAHRVPVSAQALDVLKELEGYRHESGWVFPSPTRTGQHVANIKTAAQRCAKIADVEDFRSHDLRRTGASRLTGLGIPRLVVSKILNHVESGITAVYDRHSYDPEKRHALDLWGNYVERVAAGMPAPSNVVELSRTGQ